MMHRTFRIGDAGSAREARLLSMAESGESPEKTTEQRIELLEKQNKALQEKLQQVNDQLARLSASPTTPRAGPGRTVEIPAVQARGGSINTHNRLPVKNNRYTIPPKATQAMTAYDTRRQSEAEARMRIISAGKEYRKVNGQWVEARTEKPADMARDYQDAVRAQKEQRSKEAKIRGAEARRIQYIRSSRSNLDWKRASREDLADAAFSPQDAAVARHALDAARRGKQVNYERGGSVYIDSTGADWKFQRAWEKKMKQPYVDPSFISTTDLRADAEDPTLPGSLRTRRDLATGTKGVQRIWDKYRTEKADQEDKERSEMLIDQAIQGLSGTINSILKGIESRYSKETDPDKREALATLRLALMDAPALVRANPTINNPQKLRDAMESVVRNARLRIDAIQKGTMGKEVAGMPLLENKAVNESVSTLRTRVQALDASWQEMTRTVKAATNMAFSANDAAFRTAMQTVMQDAFTQISETRHKDQPYTTRYERRANDMERVLERIAERIALYTQATTEAQIATALNNAQKPLLIERDSPAPTQLTAPNIHTSADMPDERLRKFANALHCSPETQLQKIYVISSSEKGTPSIDIDVQNLAPNQAINDSRGIIIFRDNEGAWKIIFLNPGEYDVVGRIGSDRQMPLGDWKVTKEDEVKAETEPPEAEPAEPKPADAKPTEPKPGEAAKPAEPKPTETKPEEATQPEKTPVEPKPADAKPTEPKPGEAATPANKSNDGGARSKGAPDKSTVSEREITQSEKLKNLHIAVGSEYRIPVFPELQTGKQLKVFLGGKDLLGKPIDLQKTVTEKVTVEENGEYNTIEQRVPTPTIIERALNEVQSKFNVLHEGNYFAIRNNTGETLEMKIDDVTVLKNTPSYPATIGGFDVTIDAAGDFVLQKNNKVACKISWKEGRWYQILSENNDDGLSYYQLNEQGNPTPPKEQYTNYDTFTDVTNALNQKIGDRSFPEKMMEWKERNSNAMKELEKYFTGNESPFEAKDAQWDGMGFRKRNNNGTSAEMLSIKFLRTDDKYIQLARPFASQYGTKVATYDSVATLKADAANFFAEAPGATLEDLKKRVIFAVSDHKSLDENFDAIKALPPKEIEEFIDKIETSAIDQPSFAQDMWATNYVWQLIDATYEKSPGLLLARMSRINAATYPTQNQVKQLVKKFSEASPNDGEIRWKNALSLMSAGLESDAISELKAGLDLGSAACGITLYRTLAETEGDGALAYLKKAESTATEKQKETIETLRTSHQNPNSKPAGKSAEKSVDSKPAEAAIDEATNSKIKELLQKTDDQISDTDVQEMEDIIDRLDTDNEVPEGNRAKWIAVMNLTWKIAKRSKNDIVKKLPFMQERDGENDDAKFARVYGALVEGGVLKDDPFADDDKKKKDVTAALTKMVENATWEFDPEKTTENFDEKTPVILRAKLNARSGPRLLTVGSPNEFLLTLRAWQPDAAKKPNSALKRLKEETLDSLLTSASKDIIDTSNWAMVYRAHQSQRLSIQERQEFLEWCKRKKEQLEQGERTQNFIYSILQLFVEHATQQQHSTPSNSQAKPGVSKTETTNSGKEKNQEKPRLLFMGSTETVEPKPAEGKPATSKQETNSNPAAEKPAIKSEAEKNDPFGDTDLPKPKGKPVTPPATRTEADAQDPFKEQSADIQRDLDNATKVIRDKMSGGHLIRGPEFEDYLQLAQAAWKQIQLSPVDVARNLIAERKAIDQDTEKKIWSDYQDFLDETTKKDFEKKIQEASSEQGKATVYAEAAQKIMEIIVKESVFHTKAPIVDEAEGPRRDVELLLEKNGKIFVIRTFDGVIGPRPRMGEADAPIRDAERELRSLQPDNMKPESKALQSLVTGNTQYLDEVDFALWQGRLNAADRGTLCNWLLTNAPSRINSILESGRVFFEKKDLSMILSLMKVIGEKEKQYPILQTVYDDFLLQIAKIYPTVLREKVPAFLQQRNETETQIYERIFQQYGEGVFGDERYQTLQSQIKGNPQLLQDIAEKCIQEAINRTYLSYEEGKVSIHIAFVAPTRQGYRSKILSWSSREAFREALKSWLKEANITVP